MCGIVGVVNPAADTSSSRMHDLVAGMANVLHHRGPDDGGSWSDERVGVALGFRRLAILDLSDAGHQPMESHCGRYMLVFNGEIYNHLELREQLDRQRPSFRGHSDTETLLAGFTAWGVESTISRAVGMFALAVWDRQAGTLTLGRDRLGEKPLYYGWAGKSLVFGSELKALRRHPEFCDELDHNALALYFRLKYIPAPYSVYSHVRKLDPGSLLTINQTDIASGHLPEPNTYWSVSAAASRGLERPFRGTLVEASEHLALLLGETVKGQMLSDVPLGAFLSGGVDSSTVVALMQAAASQPVKSFTVGFTETGHNEAPYANAVARHLGTDHSALLVTAEDAMAVIPSLPKRYDEPFADSSQIPTVLVAQLARQHVTVALSGDGADEVFGGYNRYLTGYETWRRLNRLPVGMREGLARGLAAVQPAWILSAESALHRVAPASWRIGGSVDKAAKLARVLEVRNRSLPAYYETLTTDWQDGGRLVLRAAEQNALGKYHDPWAVLPDHRLGMMAADMMGYLPGDILTKADRAGMSESLECRMPYLDHRVVEFAWSLPIEMKISHGTGKLILREVLYDHVPRKLIERPKAGFAIPLGGWLRGPLREWADGLLDEHLIRQQGILDPALISEVWKEHRSGQRDWHGQLWSVLMFQAWMADR